MERIAESLKGKIMSAEEAAMLVKSGDYIGFSGFTRIGYPKLVPAALAASKHATDLKICVGAAVGKEVDQMMSEAGIVSHRFGHQSDPALRKLINEGKIEFNDIHISQLPVDIDQQNSPHINVAITECTAIDEKGIYLGPSAGSIDASIKNADIIIAEVNTNYPMGLIGMHDFFDFGVPPEAKIVPILKPFDRIGTAYIPYDSEKLKAIVISDAPEAAMVFKELTDGTRAVGANVIKFLKGEVAAGRLPENLAPIQSGVGNVGNAVLEALASSGFKGLSMYTEVMQDAGFKLLQEGVFKEVSTSSIALCADSKAEFFGNIEKYRDKIIIRPQSISNNPEIARRLGLISLNTPLEVDIYGNVNSTHTMGTKMMNGLGGSADFSRNARISIFATESTAKNGDISSIVPMVSHVDSTEHDVDVIVTEQGIADLRWKSPKERVPLLIECAHPDYRPLLWAYYKEALEKSDGKHTPHILSKAFSFHERYMETGSMK